MKFIVLIFYIFFFLTSNSYAETLKYFCKGEANHFFITFNTKKKVIKVGKNNHNKYWSEANYIFWQTAKEYTVYEYTFKNSYNKLSGKLKVKSHHLITSKNNWYDYDCKVQ